VVLLGRIAKPHSVRVALGVDAAMRQLLARGNVGKHLGDVAGLADVEGLLPVLGCVAVGAVVPAHEVACAPVAHFGGVLCGFGGLFWRVWVRWWLCWAEVEAVGCLGVCWSRIPGDVSSCFLMV